MKMDYYFKRRLVCVGDLVASIPSRHRCLRKKDKQGAIMLYAAIKSPNAVFPKSKP